MTPERSFPAALALMVTTACAGAGMQDYQPVKQKVGLDAEDLLRVSREAADNLGYVPVESDSAPDTFETRQREVAVSSVPRISYRYTFRVSTQGGTLTITSTCTENSAMHREQYDDCGSERPKRVMAEQDALEKAILERAKLANK